MNNLRATDATIDSTTPPDAGVRILIWNISILDNDSLITITADDTPIAEGTSASFTITANPPPTDDLTINLTVSEDETDGQNFIASGDEDSQTVILPAGAGSVTWTVATDDDNTAEADGAVTVTIDSGTGYEAGSTNTATVNITNDDPYVLSVTLDTDEGTEGNSGNFTDAATLTFSIDPPRPQAAAFIICLGGTAERGSSADYQITGYTGGGPRDGCSLGLLSVLGGPLDTDSSFSSQIRINGDHRFEDDETVIVSLQRRISGSATPADVVISDTAGSVTYTIRNDDRTGVTLSETTLTLPENSGTDSYTVALTSQPAANVTLTATATGVTLDNGSGGNTLTFTDLNWNEAQTLTVTGTDDNLDQASRTVTINHAATASGDDDYDGLPIDPLTANLIDDDPTSVTLAGTAGNVGEGTDKAITITLGRALVSGETLAVPLTFAGTAERGTDYTLTGITASGIDYANLNSGDPTLTFTGPSSAVGTLTFTAVSDNMADADETVIVTPGTLRPGTGLQGGATSQDNLADFIITELPVITVSGGSAITEGSTATFTLTANPLPDSNLMLTLTLQDATGSDYLASEDDLTVPLNSGSATITVQLVTEDDDTDEANGPITLSVADGTGYVAGPSATVTVNDDDATEVTLTAADGDIDEGGSKTLTLRLTRALLSGESLTVPLTFAGMAERGTDYTLTGLTTAGISYSNLNAGNASVTFTGPSPTGTTLTLQSAVDNSEETSGETVIIGLGTLDATSGTNLGGGATAQDNVADFTIDDQPLIRIRGGAAITEGGTASFTLTASPVPDNDLTINLTIDDAPDYLAVAEQGERQITLRAGSATLTLIIPTEGDSTDEVDGRITATLLAGTGYNPDTTPATVTVNDNDATVVTLSGPSGDLNEGAEKTLTLSLNRALVRNEILTIPLAFTGTATFGTDYTLTGIAAAGVRYTNLSGSGSPTVTFTGPASQPARLTLRTVLDDAADAGEIITVAPGNADDSAGMTLGGGVLTVDSLADFAIVEQAAIWLMPDTLTLNEGGTGSYSLRLTAAPTSNVTVSFTGPGLLPATGSVVFSPTNWNTPQPVTLTADEDDNSVVNTVTRIHQASSTDSRYSVTATLTVQVNDNDEPGLRLSTDRLSVAEGGSGSYTVALTTEPAMAVTVTISGLSAGISVDNTTLTFTSTDWDQAQAVRVMAAEDNRAVAQPAVTLTHTASGGYDTSVTAGLTVNTRNNDTAALRLSVDTLEIDRGGSGSYTVALVSEPVRAVTVTITGQPTGLSVDNDTLTFTSMDWQRAQTVTVMASEELREDQARLTHTASGGYDGVTAVMEVRIMGGDMAEMQAAQALWLPRFGLTAIEHMLGGLHHRFSASDQPGLSGNLNGLPRNQAFVIPAKAGIHSNNAAFVIPAKAGIHSNNAAHLLSVPDASSMGLEQLGAGSADRPHSLSRTLSLPKLLPSLLRGSHFTLGDERGVSLWGQAAYSDYEDGAEGLSTDGEVSTVMLGVDHNSGQTLLGLALAYSDSDGEWQGESDAGELSGTLASILPYLRYNLTERLQLWGAASYGQGDLQQTSQTGMESEHDLEQVSATLGLRGTLLERPVEQGGLSLKLISDMTLARIESDDSEVMAGTEADTQRLRMGLAWSWQLPEDDGVHLTPELELGLRYDGGDTSEGFGLELGGGLGWQMPAKGLSVELRGRYLLEHEVSEREEWGLSGSLRYKSRPDSAYGPSFSLRQEYGNAPAASGLDRLLSDSLTQALEEDRTQAAEVSSRWTLKGEWGFALLDDATGIPYASLSASDAKRDLTLGWRLLSSPSGLKSKLDIKAIRREQDGNNPRHSIGAEWKLDW